MFNTVLDRGRVSGSGTIASLVDLLEASRAAFGPRPLFVTKAAGGTAWAETTYAQFGALVDRLRAGLTALGVGRGDKVGIVSGNRVEWAVAAYATYGVGAAFVPMYESQLEKDWTYIVRDSGMKLLFVSTADLRARLQPLVSPGAALQHVVSLDPGVPPGAPTYSSLLNAGPPAPPVRPPGDEPAALLYTSGTTGEPKGVVLTHRNVVSNAVTLRDLILATENPAEHRSLSFLPWAHAFGHTAELHMLISSGASMGIARGVDTIVEDIKDVRPTVLFAVPRVFNRIHAGVQKLMAERSAPVRWLFRRGVAAAAAGARRGLAGRLLAFLADRLIFAKVRARFGGRLKFAISGAASLSPEVARFIEAIGIAVYEGYGLTETSPIVAANVPGHRKLGSVGRALPGVRVVIDRGEIVVHGPNVMRGYHGRDAETRAVLTPEGGLRTGDMGTLDEDGYLFITGRLKEQYKLTNGKYVVPSLLEERLKVSPAIANVMIYGDNKPYNVALVVPSGGPLESADERARIKARLEAEIALLSSDFKRYERVRSIVVITEDFTQQNEMLTPSMKLRRHNILRRWRAELEGLYGPDADAGGPAFPD
jgi:long-chain acyl-CoA synthetase